MYGGFIIRPLLRTRLTLLIAVVTSILLDCICGVVKYLHDSCRRFVKHPSSSISPRLTLCGTQKPDVSTLGANSKLTVLKDNYYAKTTKKTFDAVKPNECHCKINQTILSIATARAQLEADSEVINNI